MFVLFSLDPYQSHVASISSSSSAPPPPAAAVSTGTSTRRRERERVKKMKLKKIHLNRNETKFIIFHSPITRIADETKPNRVKSTTTTNRTLTCNFQLMHEQKNLSCCLAVLECSIIKCKHIKTNSPRLSIKGSWLLRVSDWVCLCSLSCDTKMKTMNPKPEGRKDYVLKSHTHTHIESKNKEKK